MIVALSIHRIVIDLICLKVDHKPEINLWRTQITSTWSLLQILIKSGCKKLKINCILAQFSLLIMS